jgi:hypothetical protein
MGRTHPNSYGFPSNCEEPAPDDFPRRIKELSIGDSTIAADLGHLIVPLLLELANPSLVVAYLVNRATVFSWDWSTVHFSTSRPPEIFVYIISRNPRSPTFPVGLT